MTTGTSAVLERRHFGVSTDPVLKSESDNEAEKTNDRDLKLRIYAESCTTWRALVDTRFKLLALVPGAALAIVPFAISGKGLAESLPQGARLLLCIFGFCVTLGLYVYDCRNSELHDELISRARRVEFELGVNVGVFLGRPDPGLFFSHGRALALVYWSSLLAWAVAALFFVLPAMSLDTQQFMPIRGVSAGGA